jgi:hypothetical protein
MRALLGYVPHITCFEHLLRSDHDLDHVAAGYTIIQNRCRFTQLLLGSRTSKLALFGLCGRRLTYVRFDYGMT